MIHVCSTINVQLYSTDVQDAPSVTEDADNGDGEAEAAAELVRLVPICFCFWSAQMRSLLHLCLPTHLLFSNVCAIRQYPAEGSGTRGNC